MIGTKDIITAVNKLIVAALPEVQQVHINVMPKEFKRPSALIELPGTERDDVNRTTVSVTASTSVTYFGAVDARSLSDVTELNEAQDKILAIFRAGYVKVGDRALKCASSKGAVGFSDAAVDVQFNYFDDRGAAEETTPAIGEVTTKVKLRRINNGTA